MTARTTRYVPVRLDCGCDVAPTTRNAGERINCPGHGLAFALTTHEDVTFSYTAVRLDPPDPEPQEEVAADGAADA